jgi:hypothetical protein
MGAWIKTGSTLLSTHLKPRMPRMLPGQHDYEHQLHER